MHAHRNNEIEASPEITRRQLVGAAAAISAASLARPAASRAAARDPHLIARENRREGALDWQLTRVRIESRSTLRAPAIEGYCSHQSIAAGQTLSIMVSTAPPCPFKLEIFRMGYYGGRGARLMQEIGPIEGKVQPVPPVGPRRLRECQWEPSIELTIPADWPSGVYLGRLSRLSPPPDDWQSHIVFIVRDDRPADVLFQCADNTWQAYNVWPGGHSLYTGPSGALASDVDVSFDRPYAMYPQIMTECPQSVGSGEFLLWEYPLCYWLEQHGYDVSYCSNSDMLTADRGLKCKSFISVGHDEYWDVRQYHATRAMIDSGVNALFLSGNSVCWVTPFSQSNGGRPNRVITRADFFGQFTEPEKVGLPAHGPFDFKGPPAELLMGARTIVPFNGGGDWIVTRPEHWMFQGTGMKNGDRIPGLVGWEFHGAPAQIPGLEIVAEGDAHRSDDAPAHWTATIYPGPRGNFVFNAATIWWAQGLSTPPGHALPWSHWTRPHGPDARVQRITKNLLDRAIASSA